MATKFTKAKKLVQKNPRVNLTSIESRYEQTSYGESLALFNLLPDKDSVISKLYKRYHHDMLLFGYGIQKVNGTFYATCKDGDLPCT